MIKKNIYLFYAIAFLQGLVFYAPIATLYRQARGVGVFQLTLIESISLAVSLVLEVPWGLVADRIGYKKTILICNFLYFISKIVFWQAHGFGMFLVERLLLSVVMSGLSGCDTAFLYLSCGGEQGGSAQKVFGTYEAMGAAGILISAGVYSLFLQNNDSLCALITIIPYGSTVFLTVFSTDVENSVEKLISFRGQIRMLFQTVRGDRSFLLFLFAAALLSECNQTVTVFLNQLQYVRSGLKPGAMGYLYVLMTVAGLTAAHSHRLVKRCGENRLTVLLFLTGAAACLLMAFFANPILSVLCIILLRTAYSLFAPIQADIQNRRIKGGSRASVLSVNAIIMDSAAIGTNLAFGKAADFGVNFAMLLGAAFCLAALALFLLWLKTERICYAN